MAHAAGMAHHVATKEYFQMQMKLRENKYTVCDFVLNYFALLTFVSCGRN